jgi:hypothetical protein
MHSSNKGGRGRKEGSSNNEGSTTNLKPKWNEKKKNGREGEVEGAKRAAPHETHVSAKSPAQSAPDQNFICKKKVAPCPMYPSLIYALLLMVVAGFLFFFCFLRAMNSGDQWRGNGRRKLLEKRHLFFSSNSLLEEGANVFIFLERGVRQRDRRYKSLGALSNPKKKPFHKQQRGSDP